MSLSLPPILRRRISILALLTVLFVILLLPFTNQTTSSFPSALEANEPGVIVSLASSASRLGSQELTVTLLSLLAQQPVRASEIRIYLPLQEKQQFLDHLATEQDKLTWLLLANKDVIRLEFVDDLGPATKFIYAIYDLLREGKRLDSPLVILDDDHSYSPTLLSLLVSSAKEFPDASIGLRGWRVRQDMQWGVLWDEMEEHVAEAPTLAQSYRVGVLTANEAYLLYPRWFNASIAGSDKPGGIGSGILDTKTLMSTPAHLVDDIWMAGHLASLGIPRMVVPLPPSDLPSIDVTLVHTLQSHIDGEGTTRAEANARTLQYFADAWRKEGLYYQLRKSREPRFDLPVLKGFMARLWMKARKSAHHARIRLLFGQ